MMSTKCCKWNIIQRKVSDEGLSTTRRKSEEDRELLVNSKRVSQKKQTLKLVGVVLIPAVALFIMAANSFASAVQTFQVSMSI